MGEITRVGVDPTKRLIQVHGVDATERPAAARAISRAKFLAWCAQLPKGCVVAMEARSSAHHWARQLAAMRLVPKLIAPHFVSPYRMQGKTGKNDAADQFSAWLGIVPRQHSSGGKTLLGGITRRGDDYLRTLLIQGARSVVARASQRDDPVSRRIVQLQQRIGWQKTLVAVANKNARILWAVLAKGRDYDPLHRPAQHAAAA